MKQLNRRNFLRTSAFAGATVFGAGITSAYAQDEVLKVGVVHQGPISETGWESFHVLARKAMEEHFSGRVETTVLDNVAQAQDAERIFRQLSSQGHKLIMGTTFSQYATLRKISTNLGKSHFECCAGIQTTDNLGVYEARSYEGAYLTGIAAGRMTKSNILGWVGAFPVPQVLYNLNGFMLGARSVNPDVVCKVIWVNAWSDPAKEKDAINALIAQGVDVVSGSPNTPVQGQAAEAKDVWSIGSSGDFAQYVPRKQLTSFVYDWSPAYIEPAEAVLNGTWQPEARWRGLEEGGFVKMASQNPELPEDVRKEMDETQKAIASGSFQPFTGPIKDQSGAERVAAGAVLPDEELRSIDWLVEGVQGNLPT